MRQGYAALINALHWMGKHRKVDCSRNLGGALEVGVHKATVMERISNGQYTDYILQDKSGNVHKERIFGTYGWRPDLGTHWHFELQYAGDGNHHIERGGETYYLINGDTGIVVFSHDRIREVYGHVRNSNIKLKYLRMKWRRHLENI